MADKRHTSIDAKDWFHHLDGLGLLASATAAGEEAHLIRLFHNLLERAPSPALLDGLALPEALDIEALLSVGAHENAALGFLGEDTGFCVSRGGEEGYLASILLPQSSDERTAGGMTLAGACIAAMSLALADATPCPRARPALKLAGSTLLH